ncbi:MAG TPA: VCBS repeat-containing protein, partial [Bdellovibrionota bacterium]|nr:VCBS repeat-containing protein [Bdellovibrionota bacterium]
GHVGELNFVDNYSEERSRDMEPTRRALPSGLPRDFYYNLLRTCISKLRQGVLCNEADGFAGGVGTVPTGTDGCTLHDCAGNGAAGAADMGDFDGGGTDYADYSKTSATFYVHRNGGNGTFASGAGQEISVGVTGNGLDWIPVVGDFTCDGRADFLDLNRVHNMIWVHENLGATFTPQGQNWGSGTIYAPFFGMDVLAGDFNRDGCDDILTKNNRSGRLEIYLNTRNRAALFAAPVIMNFVAQVGPQWRILVGDFDGDGYADVADQALTNGTFWVHRNQGPNAGYQFAMADSFFWLGTLDAANWQNWKTVLGDFDNDGYTDYADLYVGPGPTSGHFWIHRNLRNGTFTPGGQAAGEAQSFRPDASWKILGEP